MSRKSVLQARLTKLEAAILAAYESGNISSYSTEIQGVTYRGLAQLEQAERKTRSQLERIDRGSFFGKMGFKSP